ncbi:hypothetical protein K8B33_04950 [Alcanivorax sp. JB21]|uniref:hypothetical protein n=1 Tax=Alcanivorax limicola TaxID=2874102 RepID=UPI001CBD2E5B|nr:hypothetical protein [Alcanivorax limicola]MBZ2188431.1 hypothetical protein [Alcanivorax limicola]
MPNQTLVHTPSLLAYTDQWRPIALALAAAGLLHAGTARADISYDFVQLDYLVDAEISGGSDDLDYSGFGIEVMAEVVPQFFVAARATSAEVELSGAPGVNLDFFSFGGGGYLPLMQGNDSRLDAYGSLTYEEFSLAEFKSSGGYGITAGLRWFPTHQIEINPSVAMVDYGSLDTGGGKLDVDGLRYGVRGLFHVTTTLALGLGFHFERLDADADDLDIDEIRLGVRWHY